MTAILKKMCPASSRKWERRTKYCNLLNYVYSTILIQVCQRLEPLNKILCDWSLRPEKITKINLSGATLLKLFLSGVVKKVLSVPSKWLHIYQEQNRYNDRPLPTKWHPKMKPFWLLILVYTKGGCHRVWGFLVIHILEMFIHWISKIKNPHTF